MAAPTDVRVYATSQTTAVLGWTYSGSNMIAVYRSTDGISYSEITEAGTRLAVGTTGYTDEGLSPGTKYWYKLSDDTGSTFSSVVTVYSHSCFSPAGDDRVLALPRTNGGDPAAVFDELAERIESALSNMGRAVNPNECTACPNDGAIVIDCSSGCNNWVIIADEDINSISIQWCEGEGNIDFLIPANTTRQICGWPAGFGFSGDECHSAPIVSGADGLTYSVGFECAFAETNVAAHITSALCAAKASKSGSKPSTSKGARTGGTGGGGGGGSGGGCNCVPTADGGLTIKSCNTNNSLNCSSTKSLTLIACGGRGPYTWSNTGDVVLSKSTGSSTTVTPPTNAGSAVAGTAYHVACYICDGGSCASGVCSTVGWTTLNVGCDDAFSAANCNLPNTNGCSPPAASALNKCCNNNTQVCTDPGASCTDYRSTCQGVITVCDVRTAGMITDGCNPCGLQAGATVSVTDALGTVFTIILKA